MLVVCAVCVWTGKTFSYFLLFHFILLSLLSPSIPPSLYRSPSFCVAFQHTRQLCVGHRCDVKGKKYKLLKEMCLCLTINVNETHWEVVNMAIHLIYAKHKHTFGGAHTLQIQYNNNKLWFFSVSAILSFGLRKQKWFWHFEFEWMRFRSVPLSYCCCCDVEET